MVIGRGGSGIEQIKESLKSLTSKRVDINIAEIRQPDMDVDKLYVSSCYVDQGPT